MRPPSPLRGRLVQTLLPAILLALALPGVPLPSTVGAQTAASDDPPAGIRIAELLSNPDALAGQREFIELWNAGNRSVDLQGWTLQDAATASGSQNQFTFGPWLLAAGARVVVWSNLTVDARGPSWSTSAGKAVWNDAGDAAYLLAPDGAAVDFVAYGSSSATPPPGLADTRVPAPPRGSSVALALDAGGWSTGSPTPAGAPGSQAGTASLDVAQVAPRIRFGLAPMVARPASTVPFRVEVQDDNGPEDVLSWSVRASAATLAAGTAGGTFAFNATAPTGGPWLVTATVTDRGGLNHSASVSVDVRDSVLVLEMPDGGTLRFPALAPGARNVTSVEPFVLRNGGAVPIQPLFDLSPFVGPATIPTTGNAQLGIQSVNGSMAWTTYTHALQRLPAMGAGEHWLVHLRLLEVPVPAPAGTYGTSFTVVAP